MSTNNQLIIIKKEKFYIYENYCVDNEFEPSKENLHTTEDTLEEAIKWCNNYMSENLVEYGYDIIL